MSKVMRQAIEAIADATRYAYLHDHARFVEVRDGRAVYEIALPSSGEDSDCTFQWAVDYAMREQEHNT